MKRRILYLAFFIFQLAACFGPIDRKPLANGASRWPRSGFHKKSTQKRMVRPPYVFTDAVFAYRKKYNQWPYPLEAASADQTFKKEYKRFIDQGIQTMKVIYAAPDSMLIDFVYSMDKHAAYMQSQEKYFPNIIVGQYVFVSDSSLKIFNILLGKNVKKLK